MNGAAGERMTNAAAAGARHRRRRNPQPASSRQLRFLADAAVELRPVPGSGELRCRLRNDIQNVNSTAALNAMAHPFPMRAKPTKPTLIFPLLSNGTWGSPRCSRRCVAARRYTASGCFDLALADYPSLSLPSRPTRKEHCDVEYSPIAFYPRLPAICFERGAAWPTPTWHTS